MRLLIVIPGTQVVLGAILWLSNLAEQRFLSPRSLIVRVARSRRSTPEHAEVFVARQLDRLLGDEHRP